MNVFLTLCKLSLNILKLFTELLPFMLAKLSLILANYCKEGLISPKSKDTTDNEPLEENSLPFYVKKAGFALALLLAAPLTAAFHLLYFIGCATTSPADNVRSAFNTGDTLIKDVLPSKAKAGKRLGKVVGTFFALISMATTITVYAILFPLAIKLLMTQAPAVLPNIAHGIGNFMGLFSAQAGVSVTTFLTSTLPAFLSSFGATLAGAFTLTLSHMGITPLLVGIAGLFGLVVGAGITPLTAVADKIGEEFDPIKIQLHDQPAPFDGLVYQEAATQAKMGSLLQGYNVIKKKSITTQAEGQPVENDENVPLKEYTN